MTAPILTFFNNKGGVGKTSLIYHLAWMFADLGKKVLVADLDPQANLTAAFLKEEQIENLLEKPDPTTIFRCIDPLTEVGNIQRPVLQSISNTIYLIPGDVRLSSFEDSLSEAWPKAVSGERSYRPLLISSSFWQVIQMASHDVSADIILVDIGPNLGSINRSVLISTDYVIIPLGADLFSLQGLENLGPQLINWRKSWSKRLNEWQDSSDSIKHPTFKLPAGKMQPIGYLCQQHGVRLDRPVKAYDKWINKIPFTYRNYVLQDKNAIENTMTPDTDPYCLATIKHYRSLIPMAQEHRKPIFKLTPADGAIGAHASAVQKARKDFEELAHKIGHLIDDPPL